MGVIKTDFDFADGLNNNLINLITNVIIILFYGFKKGSKYDNT